MFPGAGTSSISVICPQVENYLYPNNRAFVSVLDQNGLAITDFALGNFSIVEDDKPAIVTNVKRINNTEELLSTVICIDRSGSMGTTSMQSAITAAIAYVNAMSANDYTEIILFDDVIETTQSFTTDKTALITAINSAFARGGTVIYDVIAKGAEDCQQEGEERLLYY